MPSSVIHDFSYDLETERLTIRFVTGRVYVYFDVPATLHFAFRAARSKGTFFNAQIRDRYSFQEVTSAAEASR